MLNNLVFKGLYCIYSLYVFLEKKYSFCVFGGTNCFLFVVLFLVNLMSIAQISPEPCDVNTMSIWTSPAAEISSSSNLINLQKFIPEFTNITSADSLNEVLGSNNGVSIIDDNWVVDTLTDSVTIDLGREVEKGREVQFFWKVINGGDLTELNFSVSSDSITFVNHELVPVTSSNTLVSSFVFAQQPFRYIRLRLDNPSSEGYRLNRIEFSSLSDLSGTWSGKGVNPSGIFDPSDTDGEGTFSITYIIDNGVCFTSTTQDLVISSNLSDTCFFTGDGSNNNYTDVSNWSCGVVPNPGIHHVVIPAGKTVFNDRPHNLLAGIDASLEFNNRHLIVNGQLDMNGKGVVFSDEGQGSFLENSLISNFERITLEDNAIGLISSNAGEIEINYLEMRNASELKLEKSCIKIEEILLQDQAVITGNGCIDFTGTDDEFNNISTGLILGCSNEGYLTKEESVFPGTLNNVYFFTDPKIDLTTIAPEDSIFTWLVDGEESTVLDPREFPDTGFVSYVRKSSGGLCTDTSFQQVFIQAVFKAFNDTVCVTDDTVFVEFLNNDIFSSVPTIEILEQPIYGSIALIDSSPVQFRYILNDTGFVKNRNGVDSLLYRISGGVNVSETVKVLFNLNYFELLSFSTDAICDKTINMVEDDFHFRGIWGFNPIEVGITDPSSSRSDIKLKVNSASVFWNDTETGCAQIEIELDRGDTASAFLNSEDFLTTVFDTTQTEFCTGGETLNLNTLAKVEGGAWRINSFLDSLLEKVDGEYQVVYERTNGKCIGNSSADFVVRNLANTEVVQFDSSLCTFIPPLDLNAQVSNDIDNVTWFINNRQILTELDLRTINSGDTLRHFISNAECRIAGEEILTLDNPLVISSETNLIFGFTDTIPLTFTNSRILFDPESVSITELEEAFVIGVKNYGSGLVSVVEISGKQCSNKQDYLLFFEPEISLFLSDTLLELPFNTESFQVMSSGVTFGDSKWELASGNSDGFIIDDPTLQELNVRVLKPNNAVFRRRIVTSGGQELQASINVKFLPLIIPGAFSPNGDDYNEYFEIEGLREDSEVNLRVFNRWGQLVYESLGYKNNWAGTHNNGKKLPADIYMYRVEIQGLEEQLGSVILR